MAYPSLENGSHSRPPLGNALPLARKFRKHGMPAPSQQLRTFRIGDIVDVHVNSAVMKGMPHRLYNGRTGTVWNVSPHAVGLLIYRRVNNRIAPKRIYVRTEHIQHSKCRDDFKNRVAQTQKLKKEAKEKGIKLDKSALKRLPAQPKEAHVVKPDVIKAVCFTPFRETW